MHGRIVGQSEVVERVLVTLMAGGHVLLEGPPGLAKTLLVRALADAIGAPARRIQFTPDLLPSDILGTLVYRPERGEFTVVRGPIFTPIVIADEINRAPAKVQSALLEAMEERQVTLGGETHTLPDPFLVLATQNPLEQRGTYALAEAQLDRFAMLLRVPYPGPEDEATIVRRGGGASARTAPVATVEDVLDARAAAAAVRLDDRVLEYLVRVVRGTRDPGREGATDLADAVEHGASPRAAIALSAAARAHAFLRGRNFVTPADVKAIARDVLAHRICLSHVALARDVSADDVVRGVLAAVPVP